MSSKPKKYYWLKLKDDFFQSKEIKKLRKIAGGDTYVIIYLKLQLLSIKNGGKILFEKVEESFIEEMALTLDEDEDNVKFTLAFLEKCNLIECVNVDEYILPKVFELIGSETDAAERMRKSRENKALKSLEEKESVTLLQPCYTNVTDELQTVTQRKEKREKIKDKESDIIEKSKDIIVCESVLDNDIHTQHFHLKLTNSEYDKLIAEYDKKDVDDIILDIRNRSKEYLKKYVSFNLTLRSWLKRNGGKNATGKNNTGSDKSIKGGSKYYEDAGIFG